MDQSIRGPFRDRAGHLCPRTFMDQAKYVPVIIGPVRLIIGPVIIGPFSLIIGQVIEWGPGRPKGAALCQKSHGRPRTLACYRNRPYKDQAD